MTHRLAIVACPNAFATGISATLDLLMSANLLARQFLGAERDLFSCRVVSADGRPVIASNGYPVAVDGPPALAEDAELLILPGFTPLEPRSLTATLAATRDLGQWLVERHDAGAVVASSCSGSFLLAEAGLLAGRPATTTWWLARTFEKRYPTVELRLDELVVDSGSVICAGTAMSQLDLTLYLIERLAGRQLARLCAKFLLLDSRRASQAPYMIQSPQASRDPLIARAESWIARQLPAEIPIEELARRLAVSPRTLIRRFQRATGLSPQAFVQKLRVERARTLLETTDLRLTQILERVGYQDESAFRRLFKRHTTLSPGEYGRRFGPG